LDRLLHQETGLNVRIADNPETAIVLGAGKSLEEIGILQSLNGYRHKRR
jgi:rod shape-determining protein MreB